MPGNRGANMQKQLLLFYTTVLSSPGSLATAVSDIFSGNGTPSPEPFFQTTSGLSTNTTEEPDSPSDARTESADFVPAGSTLSFDILTTQNGSTEETETDLQSALVFGVPAVALLLLILLIIFLVKCRQRKKFKPDNAENEDIKSPIFEDDLPSVMEIEMEDLDEWMNSMKKNAAEREHPASTDDNKELHASPSDDES